jgi:hypothetical protein
MGNRAACCWIARMLPFIMLVSCWREASRHGIRRHP